MSDTATLLPDPAEAQAAASALRELDAAIDSGASIRIRLGERSGEVELSPSVVTALAQVLDGFAHGDGVTVVRSHAELTTQQAADALNVSRPFLIGLLNSGEIEYHKVGSHRRVNAASLISYMQADDARRVAAADALAAEAHALGLA